MKKVMVNIIVIGILIISAIWAFIFIEAYTNTAQGDEKVIIVLGAKMKGNEPSLSLKNRLDTAYDFATEHPDAIIITSGGKGSDEVVAEGDGMKQYLVEKGLDASRIIAETESATTEENFKNSMQILSNLGYDVSDPVVYVTNNYHCFRAGCYAKKAGFENARELPAKTPVSVFIPSCLREILALGKLILTYWQ